MGIWKRSIYYTIEKVKCLENKYKVDQTGGKLNDKDDNTNILLNLFKSVIIWAFLLMLFKIELNYILIIIGFVIGNKALSDTETIKDNKLKDILKNISRYGIIIVYFFGVYKYIIKNKSRNKKNILFSILKTI